MTNIRAASQTPQTSISMLNLKAHDSTNRKSLNKYDLNIWPHCTVGHLTKPKHGINTSCQCSANAVVERWFSYRTWLPCSHWFDHEFLHIPKYSSQNWQLKLLWNWVMQQDNGPKHSGKSTKERLKREIVQTSNWLRCCELTVHEKMSASFIELKHYCKEEWPKIHPQWRQTDTVIQ